jgi:hypothetical protein
VATFLIALWGAWTGTTAWRDARRLSLRIEAMPLSARISLERPIRVSVVNLSLRSVNIVGGDVLVGEEILGVVEEIADVGGQLKRPSPLPFTVAAGGSVAAQLRWHYSPKARPGVAQRVWRRRAGLTLRLRLEPGGSRDVAVPVVLKGRPRVNPAYQITTQAPWTEPEVIVGRRGNVSSMRLTWSAGADLPPALATLRIWSRRGLRPRLTVTRPVRAVIPLPRLPSGQYVWSVSIADEIVASGELTLPCELGALMDDFFGRRGRGQPLAIARK